MRTLPLSISAALLCLTLPLPASAQGWTERFVVSFNAGGQTTTNAFRDRFEFQEYLETASTEVEYDSEAGPVFDGGLGVNLWRGLGAGVSVSRFTKENAGRTASRFPHPFFDNQHRQVEGEVADLTRADTVVHVQAMYLVDPAGPLRIALFGGPSFFRVEQDVVRRVDYAQEYPYDTATFSRADTVSADASTVGFNTGADVMWMIQRHVGVGGVLRFTRATLDLEVESRTLAIDAGGFQAGGGIRLVF